VKIVGAIASREYGNEIAQDSTIHRGHHRSALTRVLQFYPEWSPVVCLVDRINMATAVRGNVSALLVDEGGLFYNAQSATLIRTWSDNW